MGMIIIEARKNRERKEVEGSRSKLAYFVISSFSYMIAWLIIELLCTHQEECSSESDNYVIEVKDEPDSKLREQGAGMCLWTSFDPLLNDEFKEQFREISIIFDLQIKKEYAGYGIHLHRV